MHHIPLVKPHLPTLEEVESELRDMLRSGRLTNFGPFAALLEQRVRELLNLKYALCTSNGTTGLMLLLNMLPRGSEVLVPSFTFLPTVQAIVWNSLVPVFVDIDATTYNCLPSAVASKITQRTSAILAVHTFGNPCAVEELEDIAHQNRLRLFFDSAHAFGARCNGRYLGCFGDAEVFSLSATKLLPCGEGGVIATNSDAVKEAILDRRNYGFMAGSRDCSNMGLNGKITEFSAILGTKEIEFVGREVARRNQVAGRYRSGLGCLPGLGFQSVGPASTSSYKDFTITVDSGMFGSDRDTLRSELGTRGIETGVYFDPPIHRMAYFLSRTSRGNELRNTELIAERILSLPIYSELSDDEVEYVIASVIDSCRAGKKVGEAFSHRALCDEPDLGDLTTVAGARS